MSKLNPGKQMPRKPEGKPTEKNSFFCIKEYEIWEMGEYSLIVEMVESGFTAKSNSYQSQKEVNKKVRKNKQNVEMMEMNVVKSSKIIVKMYTHPKNNDHF